MGVKKKELFESKNIFQAIMSLALPSVIGQIILVIYNMADTYFVGLTKNDAMIAAVTVCMPAFMFLSAISNLFGIGAASVISRALGIGDKERAKTTSAFAIWGCVATTILYSVGCWLLINPFLDILGGSDSVVHAYAKDYMLVAVVFGGLATAMNTLLSHLFRADGHSLQASVGIILGGVLNIALDPLFMFVIFKPGQEVLGAAVATASSNVIALVYYIIVIKIRRKHFIVSIKPSKKMFMGKIPTDVFIAGLPACLMTLCENISYAILDNLMCYYGTAAQAGVGVAKKVNMLAHSIVRGIAQGVLPLIGYNYAAMNYKRMKNAVSISVLFSVGIATICMAVNMIFSYSLVGLFIASSSTSHLYGEKFLKILCFGAPFSAFAYMIISFFQATGKGISSLLLALLRKGILDIPMMFVFNNLFPMYGIVFATPIADVICCIVALILILTFSKKHLSGVPKVVIEE